MKSKAFAVLLSAALAATAVWTVEARQDAASTDDVIVVASKPFTESRLLAEIMTQLIESRTELRVEHKSGMGLTDRQLLRLVELPLAAATIMAGIRTATVTAIGVATLAAFIGAGGLGEPIFTGLQLNQPQLILSGAVPAALLALAADFLLGLLDRAISPGR